jgi:hypothetical protein
MSRFQVGDIVKYTECPPNFKALGGLAIWSSEVIIEAKKAYFSGEFSSTAKVLKVYPADEEEPETYKLELLDNLELKEFFQGCVYAEVSELSSF